MLNDRLIAVSRGPLLFGVRARVSGMLLAVLAMVMAPGVAMAQASNDGCSTAIPIGSVSVTGSNAGATTGPDPVPACAPMTGDVWFSWTAPCNGSYTASTCAPATNFGTVVAVWSAPSGCAGLVPIGCSDVCIAGPHAGAAVTFVAVVGVAYVVSVGGNGGGFGTFELSLTLGAAMSLTFVGGATGGSLGYFVADGPANGTVFVAVTLNAGQFPFGWFLGIDIGWLDLIYQLSTGWPFVAALQPCGTAQAGPFSGLPSGLSVYAVAVALPLGGTVPVATSLPAIGLVP